MAATRPGPASCYLDYNATAPVRSEVIEAIAGALVAPGNPSSVHQLGRTARRRLEHARAAVAALVRAPAERVLFTSGGTEANNQALAGVDGPCLVSAIEHDSVLATAPAATRIPVDGEGRLDLAALERLLATTGARLVSVMVANNETGVLQPIAAVAALAHLHGALVHADAVQAAGKMALDMNQLGIDLVSLSAHKLGGPPGVGALVLGPAVEPRPLLRGGAQERRLRAGTENLPGIVGFGRAAELALADLGLGRAAELALADLDFGSRVARLRDRLEAEIVALAPAARVLGGGADRLPNTSCLTMPGVANETQLIAFDLAGIAVGAGAACSSGKVGPSHVLAAMGVTAAEASTAIRISFGWASTAADVDRVVATWRGLYQRAQARRTGALAAAVG